MISLKHVSTILTVVGFGLSFVSEQVDKKIQDKKIVEIIEEKLKNNK